MRRFTAEYFDDNLTMSREFHSSEAIDHPVLDERFQRLAPIAPAPG